MELGAGEKRQRKGDMRQLFERIILEEKRVISESSSITNVKYISSLFILPVDGRSCTEIAGEIVKKPLAVF